MNPKEKVGALVERAGVSINGTRSYDPQIKNERVYNRIVSGGSLAAGESFMDGDWECEQLDEFFSKILRAKLEDSITPLSALVLALCARIGNLQSPERAVEVAEKHYDLGNDLYEKMLGESMAYTCAYWKEARTLTEAQKAKFDLICKKIGLKQGDHILDIGCGFGAFAKHAAENYGASVVGTSLSVEQIAFAKEHTKGLPVEIRFEDYRKTEGRFDHIVSIGMFEAVGHKNFRTYFEKAHSLLKDGGIFLLHTIGMNKSRTNADPWIHKYIFPNGMIPSMKQISDAIEKNEEGLFVVEDWHNFGVDYDKTLMAWIENFDNAWPSLKEMRDEEGATKYDDRFYRMWRYYLLQSAGAFRSRTLQLWQIALSKDGLLGGYSSVR